MDPHNLRIEGRSAIPGIIKLPQRLRTRSYPMPTHSGSRYPCTNSGYPGHRPSYACSVSPPCARYSCTHPGYPQAVTPSNAGSNSYANANSDADADYSSNYSDSFSRNASPATCADTSPATRADANTGSGSFHTGGTSPLDTPCQRRSCLYRKILYRCGGRYPLHDCKEK